MNRVFLCLGGNLGNRLENIEKALSFIEKKAGKIRQTSALYEAEAWGSLSKKKYLNMCVEIETELTPDILISNLLQIEKQLGRNRTANRNSDRTLDIDVLFYNNAVINTPQITIPHPRLHLRNFVLKPLNEIASQLIHPILKQHVNKLLKNCEDKLTVKPFVDHHNQIICIEGNIGSGKTTLAKALAKKLNASFVGERFEENPLLPLFYKNNKTYALALETSFLMERFNQLAKTLIKRKKTVVCDHTIYKCLWFAKANLKTSDLKHFNKIYNTIAEELPKPDLIIYLKTSTNNLNANIRKRGRSYEKSIPSSYLKKIDTEYLKGLKSLKQIPQVQIKVKAYNQHTNDLLFKEILDKINKL